MNKRKQTGDKVNKNSSYMAKSTREQDEANPSFWLATRTGKILGISRGGPWVKVFFLANSVRSRWLTLSRPNFHRSLGPSREETARAVCSGEERGLISPPAAGDRA